MSPTTDFYKDDPELEKANRMGFTQGVVATIHQLKPKFSADELKKLDAYAARLMSWSVDLSQANAPTFPDLGFPLR